MVFSKLTATSRTASAKRKAAETPLPETAREPGAGEVIYLVSMAGYPNYGDELITRRWLTYLAQAKPGATVWLDCRHPATASLLFADDHPNLRTTDAIYRTIDQVEQDWENRSITDIITNMGSPLFDLPLIELHKATTIHLLGGGFINSQWPKNNGLIEAMQAAARVSGARLIATGQGLIPSNGQTFDGFDHVSVRDEPSAKTLGTAVGVDDAFLTAAEPGSPLQRVNNVVVCVQSDAMSDSAYSAHLDTVEEILKHPDLAHAQRTYIEAIPGNDYRAYADLQARGVDFARFESFTHMWVDGFRFAPGQFWLSTRFHHHLMAAFHGARGIALTDVAEYYGTKHDSLVARGSGWALARPGEPVPSPSDATGQTGFAEARDAKIAEARSLY